MRIWLGVIMVAKALTSSEFLFTQMNYYTFGLSRPSTGPQIKNDGTKPISDLNPKTMLGLMPVETKPIFFGSTFRRRMGGQQPSKSEGSRRIPRAGGVLS